MTYKFFNNTKHYTLVEILKQIQALEKNFNVVKKNRKKGKFEVFLYLQPTRYSIRYKIKIVAKENCKVVDVFVVSPKIERIEKGKKVPHMYTNGSLCLFYPKFNEWHYNDLWAETIIPWTSLWLFYYEVWKETGEWLGGGIHGKKYLPPEI